MAERKSTRTFNFEIIRVRLDEILEHDKDTSNFLAGLDFQTDVSVDLEYWNPQIVEITSLCTLMIVIKRQKGYVYLGTGHALRLQQQILQPHDEINALLLRASRVTLETKLNVLAAELLLLSALSRTRRFLPRKTMALWQAMVGAGAKPIIGQGELAFSRATGFSHNSVKPLEAKLTRPLLGIPTTDKLGKRPWKEAWNEV